MVNNFTVDLFFIRIEGAIKEVQVFEASLFVAIDLRGNVFN